MSSPKAIRKTIKMDDPKVLFGKRVRFFRRERGWSQEELALESNLDRTYIGSVERGERNIALVNILKIAKALSLDPKDLFDFNNES